MDTLTRSSLAVPFWATCAVAAMAIIGSWIARRRYALAVAGETLEYAETKLRDQFDFVLAMGRAVASVLVVLVASFAGCVALAVAYLYFAGKPPSLDPGYVEAVLESSWYIFLVLSLVVWLVTMGTSVAGSFKESLRSRLVERRLRHRDRQRMTKIVALPHRTRADIASNFASFESPQGRERYVDWLVAQAIRPTGEWPNGKPPNLADTASTKLARLEYGWRGFDK